jgi:hypothetical protein
MGTAALSLVALSATNLFSVTRKQMLRTSSKKIVANKGPAHKSAGLLFGRTKCA